MVSYDIAVVFGAIAAAQNLHLNSFSLSRFRIGF